MLVITGGLNTIKSHGKPPFSYGVPRFFCISLDFPLLHLQGCRAVQGFQHSNTNPRRFQEGSRTVPTQCQQGFNMFQPVSGKVPARFPGLFRCFWACIFVSLPRPRDWTPTDLLLGMIQYNPNNLQTYSSEKDQ